MKRTTFACEPIRNRDDSGALVSAGVAWRENTQLNRRRMFDATLLGAATLLCGLLEWVTRGTDIHALCSLATLAFGAATAVKFFSPAPERVLLFGVEDWIVAPTGLKYFKGTGFWEAVVSDIESVEGKMKYPPDRMRFRHDVIFFMTSGRTLHIAGDLHEEHAEEVARQLNLARLEVRATQGGTTFYVRD